MHSHMKSDFAEHFATRRTAPGKRRRASTGTPEQEQTLRAWYERSGPRLGLSYEEWLHPAVDDVMTAMRNGEPLDGPLARLGVARADAGLSVEELLRDIEAAFSLLTKRQRRRADRMTTMLSPTVAWAEAFTERLGTTTCIDATSGLASVEFLEVRAAQLDDQCKALGIDVDQAYGLVIVTFFDPNASPLDRMHHSVEVASLLRETFDSGETLASIAPWCQVAMASRDDRLSAKMRTLLGRMADSLIVRNSDLRLWLEPIPSDIESLPLLLDDLAERPSAA
jgi:hypothetical protein